MPIVGVLIRTRLGGNGKPALIKALLDTGASATLIDRRLVRKLRIKRDAPTKWTTAAGSFITNDRVINQFMFPEFHGKRTVSHSLKVCDQPMGYDMIIGRDLLQDLGITINYNDLHIEWDGAAVPLKSRDVTRNELAYAEDSPCVREAAERIKRILDAKYEPADLDKVVAESTHLDKEERRALQALLEKHKTLFDGTLGRWKDELYDVELKPDAEPYHARPFPVPKVYEKTLKMEIDRLVKAGVLKKVNRSQWAAPTFIIPKKDKTVRFISDFRELNKRIKRKPFPLPKIQDLMLKLEGFQYATSLDLNMGYYHIELSPHT